jgi:hypothetical protein
MAPNANTPPCGLKFEFFNGLLVLGLAVGQTVELGAQWLAVASGEFTLWASIEMTGDGLESNLANNMSEAPVSVFIPEEVTSVPDGEVRSEDRDAQGASRVLLYDSYPNPLERDSTSIRFTVPGAGMKAELAIFDIRGRRVRTILSETLLAGEHVLTWDGGNSSGHQVASGVYFYRLQVEGQIQIKKLVVLR